MESSEPPKLGAGYVPDISNLEKQIKQFVQTLCAVIRNTYSEQVLKMTWTKFIANNFVHMENSGYSTKKFTMQTLLGITIHNYYLCCITPYKSSTHIFMQIYYFT